MIVVAYEPVWAIGTGLTPTREEIAEVHAFTRETLKRLFGSAFGGARFRLLYGGSVSRPMRRKFSSWKHGWRACRRRFSLRAEDFVEDCLGLCLTFRCVLVPAMASAVIGRWLNF